MLWLGLKSDHHPVADDEKGYQRLDVDQRVDCLQV